MQHEAMFGPARRNAAPALRLAHDRLSGGQIKTVQKAPAPGAHPPLEAEEAAWLKKKTTADRKPIPPARLSVGQAYQSYRQGERAEYAASAARESKPWWQNAGDWVSDKMDKIADGFTGVHDASKVKDLKFSELPDGKINVSVDTLPGTCLDYRQVVQEEGFAFKGTPYNPGTVASITGKGLLKNAVKGGSVLAGMTSLASNLWTFGTNPAEGKTFWDRTVKNCEFWVSTGVDFAVSVAVGVAAAAVVAGGIVLLASVTTVALPVAVVATTIVGVVIGIGVDATDFPNTAKTWINSLLSQK